MFTRVRNFLRWSKNERLFFWEALITSFKVRWWLLLFSYQEVQSKILTNKLAYPKNFATNQETIQLIRKSLLRVKRIAVWRFQCIEQSFTAARMLKRRSIPFTLYFGVWKHQKKLKAHVWIVSSDQVIVEKGNAEFVHIHQVEA